MNIPKLNLPLYPVTISKKGDKSDIFDIIRRKYIAFSPEEYVRQQVIHYLINEKHIPQGLISVEHAFEMESAKKYRADIVVFSKNMEVLLVIECKSYSVSISKESMTQVLRYNSFFRSKNIFVTNGITHFSVTTDDFINYKFRDTLPDYQQM